MLHGARDPLAVWLREQDMLALRGTEYVPQGPVNSAPTRHLSFGTSSTAALPAANGVTPIFHADRCLAFHGHHPGTLADAHANGAPPSEAIHQSFNPAQHTRLLKRRQIAAVKKELRAKLGPPPANDLSTVRRRQALRRARNSSGKFASENRGEHNKGEQDDEDTDSACEGICSSPALSST